MDGIRRLTGLEWEIGIDGYVTDRGPRGEGVRCEIERKAGEMRGVCCAWPG